MAYLTITFSNIGILLDYYNIQMPIIYQQNIQIPITYQSQRVKRSKLGTSLVFHGIINNYFIQHWDIIGLLQHSNANNIPTKYLNTNNIPISKSETFQTWDVIGISWHI